MGGTILMMYASYDVFFLKELPFANCDDDCICIKILVALIFLIVLNSLTCSLMR